MSQPKAIVIGASRGIGQGLVQKLAREGYEAFGTIRSEPKDDHTFQVDLTDPDAASVKAAASQFDSLDLLVVSGAIGDGNALTSISPDEHRNFYNTNVIGPLTAVQAFLPALRKGKQKTVVFVTSVLGSIGINIDNARRPADQRILFLKSPYAATKAALNLLGIGLYSELSEEGFSIILIHPGEVRTDMTNGLIEQMEKQGLQHPFKFITVDESADGIVKTVQAHIASGKSDVKHVSYDGTELSR